MRVSTVLFFILGFTYLSHSQQLGFTTISPIAGSFNNGEVEFYFSLGEPLNMVVENEDATFSQGLLNMGEPNSVSTFELEGVEISAYPNPTSHCMFIKSKTSLENYTARIIDIKGHLLYKTEVDVNKVIDIQHIPAGAYFLQLYNANNESSTIKLIKQ